MWIVALLPKTWIADRTCGGLRACCCLVVIFYILDGIVVILGFIATSTVWTVRKTGWQRFPAVKDVSNCYCHAEFGWTLYRTLHCIVIWRFRVSGFRNCVICGCGHGRNKKFGCFVKSLDGRLNSFMIGGLLLPSRHHQHLGSNRCYPGVLQLLQQCGQTKCYICRSDWSLWWLPIFSLCRYVPCFTIHSFMHSLKHYGMWISEIFSYLDFTLLFLTHLYRILEMLLEEVM